MPQRAREMPLWALDNNLVSADMPEPPYAEKYAGLQGIHADEVFENAWSAEALKSAAESGVNLLWLRFFCGFGIEFEKNEMERARESVAALCALGVRTGARIALGSLAPETLLSEEPEAHNWLQVNPAGRQALGGTAAQSYLARPCYNSESYLRYMERVCNLAVDAGLDAIYFDGLGYNPEPDTCRCPTCVAAFRDFLRMQFGAQDDASRAAGIERFGHNNFTHTRPPLGEESGESAAQTPLQQEWIRFKVHTLTRCLERLAAAVSKRNAQCAIGAELLRGSDGNAAGAHGISLSGQMPLADIVRLHDPGEFCPPEHTPGEPLTDRARRARQSRRQRALDGQLELFASADAAPTPAEPVQAAAEPALNPRAAAMTRALLSARVLGALAECPDAGADGGLGLALQIAFGSRVAGPVALEEAARLKPWIEFYARNKADLLGARPIVPVALFQDAPSLAFCVEAVESRNACAAALLARNLPHEPLFSGGPEDLARYRCIVLPECVCLSDDLARRFEQYVAGGGGLAVCGSTGVRDPWRRVRTEAVFKQLLGDDYPRALQREVGGGRVAYLPSLADAAKFEKSVRFAAGAAMPFAVEAEAGSVLAAAAQARGASLLLHLVNTGSEPARGLRCAVESDRAPREALLDAPGRQPEPLAFHYDNGRAHFTLNEVRRYALVRLAY